MRQSEEDELRREFYQEYLHELLGKPPEPRYPKEVVDLARQFLREVEDYDRTVCSGPIEHGDIRCANGHEYSLVARNYQRTYIRFEDSARSFGLMPGEFRQIVREIGRLEQYPYES